MKVFKKLVILGILFFGFSSFSLANAFQDDVDCDFVKNDIKQYVSYRIKVNNMFKFLERKSATDKQIYTERIDDIVSRYLSKFEKVKQDKFYTIVWYMKCKNDEQKKYNF